MPEPREAEGQPIIGDKVKVLGASGLRYTPADGEPIPGKGRWVEVTVRGQTDGVELDFQEKGVVREVVVKASPDHCSVSLMDRPPPLPVPEGQEALPVDGKDGDVVPIKGEPDEGTEPE